MVLGLSLSSKPGGKFAAPQFPLNLLKPPITGLSLVRPIGTSFAFHVGAVTTGWGLAWATDRTDVADLWFALAVAENSWVHAVGLKMYEGMGFTDAMGSLSYREKLLLIMTTTWGLRLTASMIYQAVNRGEDLKYRQLRKEKAAEKKHWWLWTYPNIFLQYAVQQTLVSLPITLAFYTTASHVIRTDSFPQSERDIPASIAVFLFTAGFLLEMLADVQRTSKTTGVYSLVRLPGSLGDTLCHMAFYILGVQQPVFYTPDSPRPSEHAQAGYHWSRMLWCIVGPLSNYLYLRGVERNEYREKARADRAGKSAARGVEDTVDVSFADEERVRGELERLTGKNAVWPQVKEITGNKWFAIIAGAGVAGAGLEWWFRP